MFDALSVSYIEDAIAEVLAGTRGVTDSDESDVQLGSAKNLNRYLKVEAENAEQLFRRTRDAIAVALSEDNSPRGLRWAERIKQTSDDTALGKMLSSFFKETRPDSANQAMVVKTRAILRRAIDVENDGYAQAPK
jgi:hypothetical protein